MTMATFELYQGKITQYKPYRGDWAKYTPHYGAWYVHAKSLKKAKGRFQRLAKLMDELPK